MSHQPPQRHPVRWAGVLVVLLLLVVAVPLAGDCYWRAAYYNREGVTSEGCAQHGRCSLRWFWFWPTFRDGTGPGSVLGAVIIVGHVNTRISMISYRTWQA